MRVLRNVGSDDVGGNLRMEQHRLTAHTEQLWNEWEIQLLVLVSFALQVFLLFFSGFRKRTTSSVLRVLLWLAYMSADSVAIFILGHLTLHINGPRHGLVLLWAPFMLLHLGGQETITAFSLEDNKLWTRHLLSLATQVGLAAYVVGKQWQGDKQLLAAMVLMFVSGTIKYAGRTSALMLAAKQATPGEHISMAAGEWGAKIEGGRNNKWLLEDTQPYQRLLFEAAADMRSLMAFLMDMTPVKPSPEFFSLQGLQFKEHRVGTSYKLAELKLRVVYDYFYTKLGARFMHRDPLNGWFLQLVTLGSTFTALLLFSSADQKNILNYSTADIIVTYILLCGAIILEIVSIFIILSSFGESYMTFRYNSAKMRDVIFSIVRLVHPERSSQWSQKLAQYNLISRFIRQKRAAAGGRLERIMHKIGIKRDTTTHVEISYELKKLVLDKLIHVAYRIHADVWDITKFTSQWARLELRMRHPERSSSALWALLTKSIDRPDFMSTVLTWHIATDICFFHDDRLGCNPQSKTPSRELSNYVVYLSAKHGIMSGNDGHILLKKAQQSIRKYLGSYQEALDENAVIRHITGELHHLTENYPWQPDVLHVSVEPVLTLTCQLAEELLTIEEASHRWGIIINVWMEMLCYMAFHCGADFHIKHLSTGGEFITHVKTLLYDLDLTYTAQSPGIVEERSHS